MGFTVYAPRQDGNARFNTLQVQLLESSSITRVVVADGNGKFFYASGGGSGIGTVTSVSIINANGLTGTVANPTTTPAITLSTTVTGILKGDGTSITAATPGVDYITSTQGTASWSQNSISSSYALTASYALNATATSASYASTASWALNFFTASVTSASIAVTASYALTASSATNFIVSGSITASNALITGTITAQTLVVQVISSSVEYSSGSNIFGSKLTDTQQLTGSVSITGSLSVVGQVSASGFTGSLFGTASWALNFFTASVTTASYSVTASYIDPNFLLPKVFQIVTGSVSASVNITNQNLFLINSGSVTYLNISSSGDVDIYSNLFIVKNFTTKQPVLIVSESIVQIATQSIAPTGTTNAGSIWFTNTAFYVGLD